MDFSKDIIRFCSNEKNGITVIEESTGHIVYADEFFTKKYGEQLVGKCAEDVYIFIEECPSLVLDEPATEWEHIDIETKKYYNYNSAKFKKDDKIYIIHQATDITEYMSLNRDITKYMSFFKKLSSFQSAILEKLTNSYMELLPMLIDYFKSGKSYFFIERNNYLEIAGYTRAGAIYTSDVIAMSDSNAAVFETETEDVDLHKFGNGISKVLDAANDKSAYCMLCNGNVSGQRFAIYLQVKAGIDRASMKEKALVSVIQLYVENALMREKLIYEKEHDHLTGLYNKGKYLDRIKSEYLSLDSIAIYNFDVNNLKKMNDQFGHEAGDRLIIKAADSIRAVTSHTVHGYRMGGDEFLMVACNITKDEADNIKKRWESELARLNTIDDNINCVIALGMVYAEAEYDLSKLLTEADALMYEDKKSKKKPGEEIR
ncbi:MAG: GGDEF domain-containing protein [Clostridiales bacterium]|nr:GGDEF domain-containing protein [Clostridiales bacterium]